MNSGILSTEPMSDSMARAASLAPPGARPHRQAMPAAMQANGLAPEEPAIRTVEVEAFCSWSACRMKILSSASASTGLILYSSHGTAKHMLRKFSAKESEFFGYTKGWPTVYLYAIAASVGILAII